ncbi:hypothetical protein VIGAN_06186000 [Vigna angularis var. angularis]|uniref:Uncharacterized protein n=1 Tax=Vigna angularis var. angularis TaxID=157739 RepID=A0A0S3SCT9_PHAAN|nr:hypothetical protein VIGAN_06186000 [Vigna angularis var. angularis]
MAMTMVMVMETVKEVIRKRRIRKRRRKSKKRKSQRRNVMKPRIMTSCQHCHQVKNEGSAEQTPPVSLRL